MDQQIQNHLLIPLTEQQKVIIDHTPKNSIPTPIFYCWKFAYQFEINLDTIELIGKLLSSYETLKINLEKDENSIYPLQRIQEDLQFIIQLENEAVSSSFFLRNCIERYVQNNADKTVFIIAKDENEFIYHLYLQLPSVLADVYSLINIAVQIQKAIVSNSLVEESQISYSQYSSWQDETLTSLPEEIADWIQAQLKQPNPSTQLPAQIKGNAHPIKYASSGMKPVSLALYTQIKQLAKVGEVTLIDMWLALFATLLHHHTDEDLTVIGYNLKGRVYDELGGTMGRIDHNSPIIISWLSIENTLDLTQFIKKIREEQQLVAEYIGRSFINKISQGELPYVLHYLRLPDEINNYTDFQALQPATKLQLDIIETNTGQFTRWSYNETLFSASSIELLDTILQTLLEGLLLEPKQSIINKNLLTVNRLFGALNKELIIESALPVSQPENIRAFDSVSESSKVGVNTFKTIIAAFDYQYQLKPLSVALVYENQEYTYAELHQLAHKLAVFLIHEKNIKSGDIVGICTGRSPEVIIAILAIIKAGATFLPIDPTLPTVRIETILQDASPRLIFVDEKLLIDIPQLVLKEAINEAESQNVKIVLDEVKAEQLAYIIYTSGTSGKPKGCMLSHRNLSHYIRWCTESYFSEEKAGNFAWFTPLSFDLTMTSIFTPLVMGKTLTIINDTLDISETLLQCFNGSVSIDTIKLTPSHIDVLKTLALKKSQIKLVITGGEALQLNQAETLFGLNVEMEVYNEYGPTEATVGCIVKKISPLDNRITIGYPINRMEAFILNGEEEILCAGISGELYLAGDGLANGYLNNEDLTSKKFIPAKWSPSKLLYRTGDLARLLPDGEIEFLGRVDSQVKIRGYRIELSEIIHFLKNIGTILAAHVLLQKTESEYQIIAFYVSKNETLITDIQEQLLLNLPIYMLPAHYYRVTEMPLTSNGKIDEKKLISHELTINENRVAYEAPSNQVEEEIAEIWKEVLNRDTISRNDDFFTLGGQSIKAAQLVGRLKKKLQLDFQLKDIFNNTLLYQQALLVEKLNSIKLNIPQILPYQTDYEASGAQWGIWTAQQFLLQSSAYNLPAAYLIKGELNKDALVSSFELLIQQFESLRTSFEMNAQGLRQIIHPPGAFSYSFEDWSSLAIDDKIIQEKCETHARQYIDFSESPLYRASLYKLSETRWLFLLNMHHIIADGRSEEILFSHLKNYYQQLLKEQQPVQVFASPYQYKEFSAWQNNLQKNSLQSESRAYWMNQLQGVLPKCSIKAPEKQIVNRQYQSASIIKVLSSSITKPLQVFAAEKKTGLSAVLISLVETVLYRYSGQEEWAIGIPVDTRLDEVFDNQIGLFLNTIVLRNTINPNLSANTLVAEIRDLLLDGLTHKHYPFDLLVRDLRTIDNSSDTLFNVLFNLQDKSIQSEFEIEGIRFQKITTAGTDTKVDLAFNFSLINGDLHLEIDYTTDLFTDDFISQLSVHFEQLALEMIRNPEQNLAEMPMLLFSEKEQLKTFGYQNKDWNNKNESIYSSFEKTALAFPSKTALVLEDRQVNYTELKQRVEAISRYFIHHLQIKAGDIIPVIAERNIETIEVLLALQRCGAIYLPIESTYPQERIAAILSESKASLILNSTGTEIVSIADIPLFNVLSFNIEAVAAMHLPPLPNAEDSAYMIFTSGSTGKPKGVIISHCGFINMISAQLQGFEMGHTDHCLWFSSPGFDASLSEIFLALFSGSTLYIASRSLIQNQYHFLDWFNQEQISVATIPPAYLMALPDVELPTLRVLISAGEALSPALATRFASKHRLFNAYGPTENAVCTTFHEVKPESIRTSIPIGKPIANIGVKVLDKNNQLLPIGIIGELHISGIGLTDGYFQNSSQTDELFYKIDEECWYRSGDWVRWLSDGTLEYQGRRDEQIKIRGNRIELGDIKEYMLQIPAIKDAAIVYKSFNNIGPFLVAYAIVEDNQVLETNTLKLTIKAGLPDYMVPDHIVLVKNIPLNVNGKVDFSQLPAPIVNTLSSTKTTLTNEESLLIAIWKDILKIDSINCDSNFFNVGGQSLTAIQMISEIYRKIKVNISLSDIYTYPRVSELAEVLSSRIVTQVLFSSSNLPKKQWLPSTPMQQKLWADMDLTNSSKYLMPGCLLLTGHLDEALFLQALSITIEQHSALRYRFGLHKNGLEFTAVNGTDEQVLFKDLTYSTNPEAGILSFIKTTLLQEANPEKDPLCRLALIKVSENNWRFAFMLHHLIGDAWSVRLLITYVLKQYSSLIKKEDIKLPEIAEYDDYALLLFKSAPVHIDRKLIAASALVRDQLQPQEISGNTNFGFNFNLKIHEALTQLSSTYSIPYLPLISGFQMLTLLQHTQQEKLSVVTPLHGRYEARWNSTIGLFMNVIPLTISANQQQMVHEVLSDIQQQYISIIDPNNISDFSAQWIPSSLELGDKALVEIQLDDFDLHYGTEEHNLQGLIVSSDGIEDDFMARKFDLEFHFKLSKKELAVQCLFNSEFFSLPTIKKHLQRFENMLLILNKKPFITISELFVALNANEKKKMQSDQAASIRNFFKKN
jgi:amino acid adenylation domain-containing protein